MLFPLSLKHGLNDQESFHDVKRFGRNQDVGYDAGAVFLHACLTSAYNIPHMPCMCDTTGSADKRGMLCPCLQASGS